MKLRRRRILVEQLAPTLLVKLPVSAGWTFSLLILLQSVAKRQFKEKEHKLYLFIRYWYSLSTQLLISYYINYNICVIIANIKFQHSLRLISECHLCTDITRSVQILNSNYINNEKENIQ